jgi:hypothetical protein
MTIIISQSLALAQAAALSANLPLIGWRNVVTTSNIAADSSADGFPVSNLANPATHLKWKADHDGEQYVTITTGSADDFDYIGIAKPNFSAAGIAVSVEGDDGSGFDELTAPAIPADDGPLMFRFTAAPFTGLRIRMQQGQGSVAPQMAVVYAGKTLVLPRKLYQGLTPPTFGRTAKATNGRSESGNFLGRIVTQESIKTKVPLTLIDPAYYRTNIDPFLKSGRSLPFFFAWRPGDYPAETAYAWLTNDPAPTNESPHSLTALSLEMSGVV